MAKRCLQDFLIDCVKAIWKIVRFSSDTKRDKNLETFCRQQSNFKYPSKIVIFFNSLQNDLFWNGIFSIMTRNCLLKFEVLFHLIDFFPIHFVCDLKIFRKLQMHVFKIFSFLLDLIPLKKLQYNVAPLQIQMHTKIGRRFAASFESPSKTVLPFNCLQTDLFYFFAVIFKKIFYVIFPGFQFFLLHLFSLTFGHLVFTTPRISKLELFIKIH